MNQEGWGLRDVILFLVIVILAIVITMFIYNKTFNKLFTGKDITENYNETYTDIERSLTHTAHTYTDNFYYKVLEDGDEGVVTIRDMQKEKLLTVVRDIKNRNNVCSGYVYFKKTNGITNYTTYLNCPNNYQTEGYQSSLDENVKR